MPAYGVSFYLAYMRAVMDRVTQKTGPPYRSSVPVAWRNWHAPVFLTG